jgi:hypothetical protein
LRFFTASTLTALSLACASSVDLDRFADPPGARPCEEEVRRHAPTSPSPAWANALWRGDGADLELYWGVYNASNGGSCAAANGALETYGVQSDHVLLQADRFDRDVVVWTWWYDDLFIRRTVTVGGRLHGPFRELRRSGTVHVTGSWRDGQRDGVWTTHHRSGAIALVEEWRSGKRSGIAQIFSEEGRVIVDQHFEDGAPVEINSFWRDRSWRRQGSAVAPRSIECPHGLGGYDAVEIDLRSLLEIDLAVQPSPRPRLDSEGEILVLQSGLRAHRQWRPGGPELKSEIWYGVQWSSWTPSIHIDHAVPSGTSNREILERLLSPVASEADALEVLRVVEPVVEWGLSVEVREGRVLIRSERVSNGYLLEVPVLRSDCFGERVIKAVFLVEHDGRSCWLDDDEMRSFRIDRQQRP